MKRLVFILLLCLFTTNVFCAAQEQHDGKWWNNLQRKSKLYYVIGYGDAYAFHSMRELYMLRIELSDEEKKHKYTSEEIMNLIDKFYSNTKYRVLRIEVVMEFIIYPALRNGWIKEQIDQKALDILERTQE
jgi:hypothetical protein